MRGRSWQRWLSIAVVCVVIALYFQWTARVASGERFRWGKSDLFGYYNLLARGFVNGHLYLPVAPNPQLLALANPWDPAVDPALKMHDVALYNGRYYLYYGVAPAVLLFAPYRLLTGEDLPQNFAAFLFAFAGFLLYAAALFRLLGHCGVRPGPLPTAMLLLGLGVCQGMPFLLNRVDVYEVAICCGYFCTAAGLYCLLRGLMEPAGPWWLATAGLAFGLAVGSRPHLLFVGLAAAVAVRFTSQWRRYVLPYMAGYMAVGLGIATYNYARFANPLEFGLRYHLGGPGQNRVEFATANWLPGVFYFLLAPPEIGPVFPWIRLWFRFPFDNFNRYPLPPEYFLEPIAGALWTAPLIAFALLTPAELGGRPRGVALTAVGGGGCVLLFLISNHFATHRYVADFLPLLLWPALAVLAVLAARRRSAALLLTALVAYSVFVNLALGIGGPYFDLLKNRPRNYVRLASRFSASDETRPLLNPEINVRFQAVFTPARPGHAEPLLTIGHSHHNYYLFADRYDEQLHVYSQYGEQRLEHHTGEAPGNRPQTFHFLYTPQDRLIKVSLNGSPLFFHHAPLLVAAPAGITAGENHSDPGVTHHRFPGQVTLLERRVSPAP
ncbi:MAG: hypothetical protein JNK87_32290 [Bryobacterales bacterium]|nr:hypothetical protein [Bryobacterales bacterium]